MRKFGKMKKQPDDIPAKQPKIEGVLLRTYLTSLLSLVLCVGMFLGTSYAWFSSEVTNTGNELYVGILDVELEKMVAEDDWDSLEALDTDGKNTTNLYDTDTCWEPGYTSLERIKVTNKGDLAFNYTLTFTDGSVSYEGSESETEEDLKTQLNTVAEYFDVWVYDHQLQLDDGTTSLADYEIDSYKDIVEGSGWTSIGSLADVLAGKTILKGSMKAAEKSEEDTAATVDNTNETVEYPAHEYTIALHMRENADASVMGYTIGLNVKLVAYQMSSEQDGFGNGDFDDSATPIWYVSDTDELLDTLSKAGQGDTIVMKAGTYTIEENEKLQITTNYLNLKGEGTDKTIIETGKSSCSGQAALYISANYVTISDLTIISAGDNVESEEYSNIDAIKVSNLNNAEAIINNVTLRNLVVSSNGNGVNLHGADKVVVDNVKVEAYGKCGFSLANATNVKFTNCETAKQANAWADIGCMYKSENTAYKNPCQFTFDETNTFGKGVIYSERPESAGYDTVAYPEAQWTKQSDPAKGWALTKNP